MFGLVLQVGTDQCHAAFDLVVEDDQEQGLSDQEGDDHGEQKAGQGREDGPANLARHPLGAMALRRCPALAGEMERVELGRDQEPVDQEDRHPIGQPERNVPRPATSERHSERHDAREDGGRRGDEDCAAEADVVALLAGAPSQQVQLRARGKQQEPFDRAVAALGLRGP